ncbi:MAG: protein kinase domain-containing protein, partial [Vicinamibacterales bacterium]
GVIHRDLKPANIMLTKAGTKLLDFGVAKMTSAILERDGLALAGSGATSDLTSPGSIPGTLPYMAPEQLEGKEADTRSDLFAFGCVLYEMIAGRKAFQSESAAGLVTAIMTSEPPPIGDLCPGVAEGIAYVIERCLAKDPDDRWQTARDLLAVLTHTGTASSRRPVAIEPLPDNAAHTSALPSFRSVRAFWPWAAAMAIGSLAIAFPLVMRPTVQAIPARLSVLPPVGGFDLSPDPRLSPDGRYVAFKAVDALSHRTQIWLRALDATTAAPLLGTEDTDVSCAPFWSPDSRSIGFFARGKLKRVDVDGGAAEVLAPAPEARGGTWTRDGTIVFNADTRTLLQIPASGGTAKPAMAGPVPGVRLFPYALPDGRHYLFTSRDVNGLGQGIYVGALDSVDVRRVSDAWSPGVYAEGRLLFVRQDALFAQAFDPERLVTSGDARQIGDHVGVGYGNPLSFAFSAAARGGLAIFWTGMAHLTSQLTWYSRSGAKVATVGEQALAEGVSLAPGGAHGVVELVDRSTSTVDLWLFDPAGAESFARLTSDGRSSAPVFSPAGDRILVEQRGVGLFFLPLAGSAGRTLSDTAATRWPSDWSLDGRFVAFTESAPQSWSLWTAAVDTGAAPVAYRRAPFVLESMTFAPDVKSVAYVSDESGQREVYVDSYPFPTKNLRVSTAGGMWPKWRADGKELFYLAPDRRVMAVTFEGGASKAAVSTARPLFEGPAVNPDGDRAQFAPSADGSKFLFNAGVEDPTPKGLSLIVNWPALLQSR